MDKDGERHLDNADLKVGGEGMKGFYDKILPDFANKFGKKFGAKVEESNFGASKGKDVDRYETENFESGHKEGEWSGKAHTLEITPAMREAALGEGFPLFQGGQEEQQGPKRGFIRFNSGHSVDVQFMKSSDPTTWYHELTHLYTHILHDLANGENATPQMKADYKALWEFAGATPGEKLTVEQQEKIAKAGETYFLEGKAPTAQLRPVMDRIKKWFLKVYQTAKGTGQPINDTMRGVFDRMLATQEEIDQAAQEMGFDRLNDLPGIPKGQVDEFQKLFDTAQSKAANTLFKSQMTELEAKHQTELAKAKQEARETARKIVGEQPLYKAEEDIQTRIGVRQKVADLALDIVNGKGDPKEKAAFEVAAEMHGFPSGRALAKSLLDADVNNTKAADIDREMAVQMAPHADLKDRPGDLHDKALRMLLSKNMTEILALQGVALDDTLRQVGELKAEITGAQKQKAAIQAQEATNKAKEWMEDKNLRDAQNYRVYTTQERNAAVARYKALKGKDPDGFEQANRQMVVNHAMAREALANRGEIKKTTKYLKDQAQRSEYVNGNPKDTESLGKMPYGHARQVDALLALHGFKENHIESDESLRQIAKEMLDQKKSMEQIADATGFYLDDKGKWQQEDLKTFQERVNENDMGYAMDLPEKLFTQAKTDRRSMSLADLRALNTAVHAIEAHGKGQNKFFDKGIKKGMQDQAVAMFERAQKSATQEYQGEVALGHEHPRTALIAKLKALGRMPGELNTKWLLNTLTLCEAMDGGHDGPWHEAVYRVMLHGEQNKLEAQAKIRTDMPNLAKKYFKDDEMAAWRSTPVKFDFLGDKPFLHMDEIISMGMNSGNLGNLKRLIVGYGLDHDDNWHSNQLDQILGTLGKKHWDYIQDSWDYLGTYWPDILKQEMEMRGIAPKEVEPLAFTNRHGTYKGGYFPIEYDPEKSEQAHKNAEESTALFKQFSAATAHTEDGHTQARARMVNRPLKLSSDVMFNHLENVVHDLAFRRAVVDVARILRQPPVKAALFATFGHDGPAMLNSWVKNIASDQRATLGAGADILRWFRFRTTIETIGYRPVMAPLLASSNILNFGLEKATDLLTQGPQLKRLGDMQFMKDPRAVHDFVITHDPRMAQRNTLRDATIAEMKQTAKGGTALQKAGAFINMTAFVTERVGDMATSDRIWLEAYDRALHDFHDENKARDMAQEAVTRTVGSGSMLDQPGFQRNEVMKTLAPYMTWGNMMWNKLWLQGKIAGLEYRKENLGTSIAVVGATLAWWAAIGQNENFWREKFRNTTAQGPAEDKEKHKRMIQRTLETGMSWIPILGQIAPYVIEGFSGEQSRDPNIPLLEAFKDIVQPLQDLGHLAFTKGTHVNEKFIQDTANSVNLLLGKPKAITDRVFNFYDALKQHGDETWKQILLDTLGGRRVKK